MNINDLVQRLLQEKTDHNKGQISTEVLKQFTNEMVQALNLKSRQEAEGLTPDQLYGLIYFLFSKRSVVQLNNLLQDETALQSPLLKLCISYLEIIQRENSIKLTKTDSLPVKIITELYGKGYIIDVMLTSATNVRIEKDSTSIQLMKILSTQAGLTEIQTGKLSLTAKGISLLNSPAKLLILLTEKYFIKFAWSYFDFYESRDAPQYGAGFILILLQKYGDQEREATFYSKKFIQAFPSTITEFVPLYGTPEKQFGHCFTLRTFQRGLNWMGLVETRETGTIRENNQQVWVKTTKLFDELISINTTKRKH